MGRPWVGRSLRLTEAPLDIPSSTTPRFLYVAACYDSGESSAYYLLVTSDEEHDLESDEGAVSAMRLLAQASERRDWYVSDEAFREGVRATYARISAEIHELGRYSLATIVSAAGAWTPAATDPAIWREADE